MTYGTVISKGHNQDEVFFKMFGSYQGDWILVTKDSENFYIYKGWYGSCAGCDSLEAFENYEGEYFWTNEKCIEFAKNYAPFIIVPKDRFISLCNDGNLKSIMPANTRLEFSDDDYEEISDDIILSEIQSSLIDKERTGR